MHERRLAEMILEHTEDGIGHRGVADVLVDLIRVCRKVGVDFDEALKDAREEADGDKE